MEDKLNIAEILGDALTGTLLYSPIFGELAYIGCYVDEGQTYSIIVCQYPDAIGQGDSVSVEFDENGTYLNRGYSSRRGGECMLFPSKENRNWNTFKIPKRHKEFKPYQRVLVREWCDCKSVWTASLYSHYDDALDRHCLLGSEHVEDDRIIPYEGNENKLGNTIR